MGFGHFQSTWINSKKLYNHGLTVIIFYLQPGQELSHSGKAENVVHALSIEFICFGGGQALVC